MGGGGRCGPDCLLVSLPLYLGGVSGPPSRCRVRGPKGSSLLRSDLCVSLSPSSSYSWVVGYFVASSVREEFVLLLQVPNVYE